MDVWGEPEVTAEAELVGAIFSLLDAIGLARGDVKVRVNSRALLEESLRGGVLAQRPEVFEPLCVVIDKIAKVGADTVVEQLTDPQGNVGLDEASAREVIALLSAQSLDQAAEHVSPDSPALADLRRFFDLLEAYGVRDQVVFDASVVRGLAYYTGIVFEAFDTGATLRSICGGGRYDGLSEKLGGKAIPAVGFGFGDVVIGELLADKDLWPELPRPLDDMVFALSEGQRPAAIAVASRLRRENRRVELVLGQPKLKRAMADADRAGATRIWLLGPDEVERGMARVRDLASGEEHEEPLNP
jgi:histidyl-tRNA synthetase